MAEPTDPSPADDFGATSLDRVAITFDEVEAPAVAPAQPMAVTAPPRQVVGPAWAGTLPGIREEPAAPPAAPAFVVAPPVQAVPTPVAVAPPAPTDPTDFAKTTLHQRAHPEPTGAPIKELDERAAASGHPAAALALQAEEKKLKIALAIVVGLIAVVLIALVIGIADKLSEPIDETMETEGG